MQNQQDVKREKKKKSSVGATAGKLAHQFSYDQYII